MRTGGSGQNIFFGTKCNLNSFIIIKKKIKNTCSVLSVRSSISNTYQTNGPSDCTKYLVELREREKIMTVILSVKSVGYFVHHGKGLYTFSNNLKVYLYTIQQIGQNIFGRTTCLGKKR